MKKGVLFFFGVTAFLGFVGSVQAAIININSKSNAINNPVVINFEAGTYDVVPIGVADGGGYNAWSACNGHSNTWVHRYCFSSSEFGGACIGGTGSGPYSATEMDAFNTAISTSFTLTSGADVNFYVWDGPNGYEYARDNVGGVSLDVSAVPIPSALWLLSSGLMGIIGIGRKLKKS